MTLKLLKQRLDRIELKRHVGAPTAIMAFRPMEDGEGADALAHWREWVADGRARVCGSALVIQGPRLTVEEWVREYGCDRTRH